jgi:hypothetical protein
MRRMAGSGCASRLFPLTAVACRQVLTPVDEVAASRCRTMSKVPMRHHSQGTGSVCSNRHAEAELYLRAGTMGRLPGMT